MIVISKYTSESVLDENAVETKPDFKICNTKLCLSKGFTTCLMILKNLQIPESPLVYKKAGGH